MSSTPYIQSPEAEKQATFVNAQTSRRPLTAQSIAWGADSLKIILIQEIECEYVSIHT